MQPSGCLVTLVFGPLVALGHFFVGFVILTIIGMTFGSIRMGMKVGLERFHLYAISTVSALLAIWVVMRFLG